MRLGGNFCIFLIHKKQLSLGNVLIYKEKMARDLIHALVRRALEKDGWEITDDPLYIDLESDNTEYEIDLGAEKLLGAQKGEEKIAVEIKSLFSHSPLSEFHTILGQYLNYKDAMNDIGMQRILFVAFSDVGYSRLSKINFVLKQIKSFDLKIIVIDTKQEKIMQWIK